MLRKRSDGAYRLIVGSFRSATAAEGYARLLRDKRYQVRMTTRAVSDDLELYRVEIDGLKNLDEATHVWQTGLDNQWLAFAGQSSANR
jgi:hypothetical protein